MIQYYQGDFLNGGEQLVIHCCNTLGKMGKGAALSVAKKYPKNKVLFERNHVALKEDKLGSVLYYKEDNVTIANMYTQDTIYPRGTLHTNYSALRNCLFNINDYCIATNIISVALPYGMGCNLAGGDWDTVLEIVNQTIGNLEVGIYIFYKKEYKIILIFLI